MGENVREVAERILFSSSIEDKLLLGPREAEDNCCGKAIKTPQFPERPGLQENHFSGSSGVFRSHFLPEPRVR